MKTRKVTFTLLMVVGFMILFMTCSPEAEAAGKLKTITVTKINQKTARKVHKQLMQGKAFKIRFKGSEKNFYKKFQKLTKKVAKQTDVGLDVFPICMKDSLYFDVNGTNNNPKKNGKYTTFIVKKFHCQEYIYGIKFAEREYKGFRAYIDKLLKESENLAAGLQSGTVMVDEANYKSRAQLYLDTQTTIADLRELSKYLRGTKFRNLSSAMKARIVLEIGSDSKSWEGVSMRHSDSRNDEDESFKALFKKKAYGDCLDYAIAICKICAAFNIGEFDHLKGSGAVSEVARIKVMTRSGGIRYAILENGVFEPYNDYVGFFVWDRDVIYRRPYKKVKPIKKIKKTQQLQQFSLIERRKAVYETFDGVSMGNEIIVYKLNIPKSEW